MASAQPKLQAALAAISERLGTGFWVRSWQDLNRNLFSAMKLERGLNDLWTRGGLLYAIPFR